MTSFVRRTDASKAALAAAVREADLHGCTLPEGLRRRAAKFPAASTQETAVVDLVGMELEPEEVDGESALSAREGEILRLVADGYDTADVAEQLAYSESTIRGVLTKVMTRLEARNRCHAVAVAVRQGLI